MGRVRSVELKNCMKNSLRFDTNLQDEKYFNCDVCYTCKSFNPQTNECTLTWDEAKKRAGSSRNLLEHPGPKYFKTVKIKRFTWYRCSVWEERR